MSKNEMKIRPQQINAALLPWAVLLFIFLCPASAQETSYRMEQGGPMPKASVPAVAKEMKAPLADSVPAADPLPLDDSQQEAVPDAVAPQEDVLPEISNRKVDVTILETEIDPRQMLPQESPEQQQPFASVPSPEPQPTASAPVSKDFNASTTASPAPAEEDDLSKVEIQGRQIVQINQSLRRIIEENEKLRQEKEELDKMIRTIRGQRNLEQTRVSSAIEERDRYKKQIEALSVKNKEFSDDMKKLQEALDIKERWLNSRMQVAAADLSVVDEVAIARLQSELPGYQKTLGLLRYDLELTRNRVDKLKSALDKAEAQAVNPESGEDMSGEEIAYSESEAGISEELAAVAKAAGPASAAKPAQAAMPAVADAKGRQVMALLDDMAQRNQKMQGQEAKIHYNMGNRLVREGDYAGAAKEYRKAIELQPEDSNSHFNLAFVCGEFVKDYRTAEKHYRQYLILNPTANDSALVKEKIIEADLMQKSMLDRSLTEKDWQKARNSIYTQ